MVKNKNIDNIYLRKIDYEKQYWKNVLKLILSTICYLAKNGDVFHWTSDVIHTENNGKFLGIIEIVANFDTVIQKHLRRIKNKETHDHYLCYQIQDGLIELIVQEIRQQFIEKN